MQLSELRKRVRRIRGIATFRGDEGLVPDARGSLKPIDCIERKLGTLLIDEASVHPPQAQRGTGEVHEIRVARRTFE